MAFVAIKIWSHVAQRNEDMTACSMFLPVIAFGIIFTIYGYVTRNHQNAKLHTLVGLSKCFTYDIRI